MKEFVEQKSQYELYIFKVKKNRIDLKLTKYVESFE